MTTPLEKTLKRELLVNGRAFVLTLSPEGLKLTRKGGRKGLELKWADLVSGEAALAVALNASIGRLAVEPVEAVEPRGREPTGHPASRPKLARAKRRARCRE